ncbi:unnamed protein product [Urochloa humidicola]
MYGSPVSKDLNLPVQPPMTSSGLLRYRSAPSTLLGEVCEDFLNPVPRAGSPDPAADNAFSRFLADHQIRDKPPAPPPQQAPAVSHFPDTAAAMAASHHQQQQQMMFHSQHQHQQQQQMAAVESGLYRTVSSGMEAPTAAGAAGASSLIRQSSSPAGFLNHLNMDNGYGGMLRAGMGVGAFRNGATAAAAADSPSGAGRLKGQLSFSSRQGSLMSQISEMGSEELGGSSPEGAGGGGRGFIPGYPMSSGWEDTSSLMSESLSGSRDETPPGLVGARPERPDAAVQLAQDIVGDGGAREVPPVRGRRALQDPRQARMRHAPTQHRRAGEEDKDQRANQEAPGARAQHGQANQHFRHAGFCRRLHQGSPEAGQGAEREPRQLHLLGEQEPAVLRLKAPGARPQLTPCKTPGGLRRRDHLDFGIEGVVIQYRSSNLSGFE